MHVYKASKRNKPDTALKLLTKPESTDFPEEPSGHILCPAFYYWAAPVEGVEAP